MNLLNQITERLKQMSPNDGLYRQTLIRKLELENELSRQSR